MEKDTCIGLSVKISPMPMAQIVPSKILAKTIFQLPLKAGPPLSQMRHLCEVPHWTAGTYEPTRYGPS